jgi:hypothetical protein
VDWRPISFHLRRWAWDVASAWLRPAPRKAPAAIRRLLRLSLTSVPTGVAGAAALQVGQLAALDRYPFGRLLLRPTLVRQNALRCSSRSPTYFDNRGTPQSAVVSTPFATPLAALLIDGNGDPCCDGRRCGGATASKPRGKDAESKTPQNVKGRHDTPGQVVAAEPKRKKLYRRMVRANEAESSRTAEPKDQVSVGFRRRREK